MSGEVDAFDRASALAQMQRAAQRAAAKCLGKVTRHPVEAIVTVPILTTGKVDYLNAFAKGEGMPRSGWEQNCIVKEFWFVRVRPFEGGTEIPTQRVDVH